MLPTDRPKNTPSYKSLHFDEKQNPLKKDLKKTQGKKSWLKEVFCEGTFNTTKKGEQIVKKRKQTMDFLTKWSLFTFLTELSGGGGAQDISPGVRQKELLPELELNIWGPWGREDSGDWENGRDRKRMLGNICGATFESSSDSIKTHTIDCLNGGKEFEYSAAIVHVFHIQPYRGTPQ